MQLSAIPGRVDAMFNGMASEDGHFVQKKQPVVISVEQASGTVVFELDEPFIWEDRWNPRPGIWIDGVPLDRFVLQEWAAVQSVNNQGKEEYRVPALPPGRVTACWAAPTPENYRSAPEPRTDSCQQGFLGPGDELRFRFEYGTE